MKNLLRILIIFILFMACSGGGLATQPEDPPKPETEKPQPPPRRRKPLPGGKGGYFGKLQERFGGRRRRGGLGGLGGFDEKMDEGNKSGSKSGGVPPEVADKNAGSNNGGLVVHQPGAKELRERVKALESKTFNDVEPVSSTEAASEGVKRLRAELERMRSQREHANLREARRLGERMKKFGERWQPAAEAMLGDPDKVSAEDWNAIAKKVLTGEEPEKKEPEPKPKTEPNFDDVAGFDKEPEEGAEPAVEPPPKPKEIVDPKKLAEGYTKLAEAIKNGAKPKGMSAEDWVALLDEYYRDMSDLYADAGSTNRKLDKKRDRELAALEEAVKDAERQLGKAKDREKIFNEGQKNLLNKYLAWKKHQAELAAARAQLRDAERLEQERAGEESGRVPVGGYGGAVGEAFVKMGKALENAFRQLDTQGHGPAPPAEMILKDGLPMPGWMGENIAANQHGIRSLAKIRNYMGQLARTRMQIANCDRYIVNQDRDKVRWERAFLERLDQEAGKLHNPYHAGIRRKKLRNLIKRLNETRADRIDERRAMFERDTADYRKLLEAEVKRYDAMWPKPEPKPEPEENDDVFEDNGN